ncbi:DNA-binding IclR family transcriptional regulator [Rhizobium pisi]|jgi:DNA-binding IclR family transcriptional regulator|uniref:DNA-binding IclR family transcriptional regulator n=2 Tax=Rhizobium pisi TaxID=574561 RepID=A0A7W5BTN8_9HYPH|nr:IclR family transcriptional regulator [Rhizobium pisi]MBB3138944.1 DNA-binding IclR family transcriptional regulator [Rhizobium pisi]
MAADRYYQQRIGMDPPTTGLRNSPARRMDLILDAPKKTTNTMKTVDKAFNLLNYFTISESEFGLSELARKAELDKATTLRILTSLMKHGFIEQVDFSKKYRLGASVLRFAKIREATFPIASTVQPWVDWLAEQTSETAHASLASEDALTTIAIAEPARSTRVFVDLSQPLPFHATASGLAYLAFAHPDVAEAALAADAFPPHTDRTPRTADEMREMIAKVRQRGYAVGRRSFETEVTGIAAPIFNAAGHAFGAIAVASIASRTSEEVEVSIARHVVRAAIEVSRALGADSHPSLLAADKAL